MNPLPPGHTLRAALPSDADTLAGFNVAMALETERLDLIPAVVAAGVRRVRRALYRHVWALAQAQPDVCGVRLYVERDNAAAQRTYRDLGMGMTEYHVMEELRPGLVWKQ